jgi:hypothetical protein
MGLLPGLVQIRERVIAVGDHLGPELVLRAALLADAVLAALVLGDLNSIWVHPRACALIAMLTIRPQILGAEAYFGMPHSSESMAHCGSAWFGFEVFSSTPPYRGREPTAAR